MYPNENKYELENAVRCDKEINDFLVTTDYFYTKNDSLIKVILYQWHNPKKKSKTKKSEKWKRKNNEKFETKFNKLKKKISKIYGSPSITEYNTDQFPYTRNEYRWKKEKKIEIYLFKGNYEPSGSYHIELSIYPK